MARDCKISSTLHELLASQSEPPGHYEYELLCYKLRATVNKLKLDTNDDGVKGDVEPVFVINGFYYEYSRLKSTPTITITLNDVEDTDIGSWISFPEAYANLLPIFAGNDYLGEGSNPIIVVSAFEDDQLVSDDTRRYMDYGLDLAQTAATLDPTGISTTLVSIVSLAWDIVLFLDWLDADDMFIPSAWQLDETLLTNIQDNQDEIEFLPRFFLEEEGGGNRWHFEVKAVANNIGKIGYWVGD